MKSLIEDAIRRGFKCDPKESKAIAEVTEIGTPNGKVYEISAAVEILPYPNELKWGGYYQLGIDYKTLEERDSALALLREEFELYKQIGMSRIEIIQGKPRTQVTQFRMVK